MSSSKNHKSAFKLWLSDSRPFLEERFKNLSNEELSKKISEIWRTGLQPDVKKSYLEKEKELKEKGTMSSNFSFWILAKLRENGLFDERMSVKENWKYLKEETKNWYKEEFVKYRANPVENITNCSTSIAFRLEHVGSENQYFHAENQQNGQFSENFETINGTYQTESQYSCDDNFQKDSQLSQNTRRIQKQSQNSKIQNSRSFQKKSENQNFRFSNPQLAENSRLQFSRNSQFQNLTSSKNFGESSSQNLSGNLQNSTLGKRKYVLKIVDCRENLLKRSKNFENVILKNQFSPKNQMPDLMPYGEDQNWTQNHNNLAENLAENGPTKNLIQEFFVAPPPPENGQNDVDWDYGAPESPESSPEDVGIQNPEIPKISYKRKYENWPVLDPNEKIFFDLPDGPRWL
ncbi:hypothetical protein L5515_015834 [Caenorhabditis briggsae]|uniref:HMG box domain-containing protein n=1 Tax=Caenorhabditis briggsae TaxID=6238 RepID=A0AAE9JAP8_CAEBR|nr:hypothetical protein L5515_015834 [Caenorhabditis briggsae]